MADILVTSTGKKFFQIDSQIAALLCEAFPASFANVAKTPPAPVPVHFGIKRSHHDGRIVGIYGSRPGEILTYTGESIEGARRFFAQNGMEAAPGALEAVFSEMCARYAPPPSVAESERARIERYDQERAQNEAGSRLVNIVKF